MASVTHNIDPFVGFMQNFTHCAPIDALVMLQSITSTRCTSKSQSCVICDKIEYCGNLFEQNNKTSFPQWLRNVLLTLSIGMKDVFIRYFCTCQDGIDNESNFQTVKLKLGHHCLDVFLQHLKPNEFAFLYALLSLFILRCRKFPLVSLNNNFFRCAELHFHQFLSHGSIVLPKNVDIDLLSITSTLETIYNIPLFEIYQHLYTNSVFGIRSRSLYLSVSLSRGAISMGQEYSSLALTSLKSSLDLVNKYNENDVGTIFDLGAPSSLSVLISFGCGWEASTRRLMQIDFDRSDVYMSARSTLSLSRDMNIGKYNYDGTRRRKKNNYNHNCNHNYDRNYKVINRLDIGGRLPLEEKDKKVCGMQTVVDICNRLNYLVLRMNNTCNMILQFADKQLVLQGSHSRWEGVKTVFSMMLNTYCENSKIIEKYSLLSKDGLIKLDEKCNTIQFLPLINKHCCLILHLLTLKQCNWRKCRNKIKKLRKCKKCKSTYYCSRICQKKDWTGLHGHRSYCKLLNKRDIGMLFCTGNETITDVAFSFTKILGC